MTNLVRLSAVIIGLYLLTAHAAAQQWNWINTGTGNWFAPGNWFFFDIGGGQTGVPNNSTAR